METTPNKTWSSKDQTNDQGHLGVGGAGGEAGCCTAQTGGAVIDNKHVQLVRLEDDTSTSVPLLTRRQRCSFPRVEWKL